MKKILLAISFSLFLFACDNQPTVDTSSPEAMDKSMQEIGDSIQDENKKKELANAVVYFGLGGKEGVKALMAQSFSGNFDKQQADAAFFKNMQQLDGLNADEIIEKYNEEQKADKSGDNIQIPRLK